MDIDGAPVRDMIRDLVVHHVAVTSTLAIFEISCRTGRRCSNKLEPKGRSRPEAWSDYLRLRSAIAEKNDPQDATHSRRKCSSSGRLSRPEACCWRAAIRPDSAACCRALAISADLNCWWRRVYAGGSDPLATQNGAVFLGEDGTIGSIGAGKAADLVVIAGNPAQNIEDVEKVEMVFKDGLGYDPVKLTQSVQGMMGLR